MSKNNNNNNVIDLTSMDDREDVDDEYANEYEVVDVDHPSDVAADVAKQVKELLENKLPMSYEPQQIQIQISNIIKVALPRMHYPENRAKMSSMAVFDEFCMKLAAKLLAETETPWGKKILREFHLMFHGLHGEWHGAEEDHPDSKGDQYQQDVQDEAQHWQNAHQLTVAT